MNSFTAFTGPCLVLVACLLSLLSTSLPAEEKWVSYSGQSGPGKGKRVVFVTGDEEYRSEEGMPQLARILSVHHGFDCTVLFALNDQGEIDPNNQNNIPGLEALENADLMVIFTRFRDLPDDQMKHIVKYAESGKPIVGLRTATHAFQMKKHKTYLKYSWRNSLWKGGFGKQILGETWVAHHGGHGTQSTRGLIPEKAQKHPIVRGIKDGDIWDPSDVYTVRLPMAEGIEPVIMGQVLDGMKPDDKPAGPVERKGKMINKNDPMMPVAWTKTYTGTSGKSARIFATTMGTSQSFTREGTRRLLVNACYWALEMEDQIQADSKVDIVGTYEPTRFGFNKFKTGVKPADHALDQ